jgi:hydroxyacylglutathione hydrolase
MLIQRLYDTNLAQASYLIGCQATGDAIVVDPNRDIAQYIALSHTEGLRISAVTETHIHADFVSGSRALAQATGARLYLSGEGGPDWQYAYATSDGARLLRDRDIIAVGNILLTVMHTPGHTPEHLSFVVTDTPADAGPMGILTGDFLFVGDVGRPDLLEKAAQVAGTMEASARDLYLSLQRIRQLPDYLQIWPGHGAGSACGKSLGAVPSSTLGYEKHANWALRAASEVEFVAQVLEGQPEPPTYFAEMKRINRDGPRVLDGPPTLSVRSDLDVVTSITRGELVIDTRPAASFADAHIPGTINIPLNKSFSTWAGWLVPYDAPFTVLLERNDAVLRQQVLSDLSMIGLDNCAGFAIAWSTCRGWQELGNALQSTAQLTVEETAAAHASGALTLIDVRGHAEWDAGHIPNVRNIPVGALAARLREIPLHLPVALHCQGGGRSAIGASVLRALGVATVSNVTGGYAAWQAAGLPTERVAK